MIRRLNSIRLRPAQTLVVCACSALATAVLIAVAVGPQQTPAAVLLALRHRVVVERHAQAAPPAAGANAAPAPAVSQPVAPAPSSSGPASQGASTPASATTPSAADATTPSSTATSSSSSSSTASKVKHVFVLALSSPSYSATWGRDSALSFLTQHLRPMGTLLTGYRSLGGSELGDYLALVSGQAPNPDTEANCPDYAEFGAREEPSGAGLMRGVGCIYPNTVLTIGDQVTASGRTWRAYLEGMGSTSCVHANSDTADDAPLPGAEPQYATRHNPFIYFHSLLDLGDCSTDDLSLSRLPAALRSVSSTPTFSFIAPGLCADASALGCPSGGPAGLAAENAFLAQWVPRILGSAAYRRDGALVILFAPGKPEPSTAGAQPGAAPGTAGPTVGASTTPQPLAQARPVRTGALVISRFGHPGASVSGKLNAYSVLATIEGLLGYQRLGHASHARRFIGSVLAGA